MSDAFRSDELFASHIPAIELLVHLGYQYLAPEQLLAARGGRFERVLLEEVLRQQLQQLNRIHYREHSQPFSEANVNTAIERLKEVQLPGLLQGNARIYDLLTLGVNLEQTVAGDTKNFTLRYLDWEHPERNVFHVCSDFTLESGRDAVKLDILLFVNGIPFVAINCVAPQALLQQAQASLLRQQNDNVLAPAFLFAQLVIALNSKEARYATVGTRVAHWACWREPVEPDTLREIRSQDLTLEVKAALFDLARQRLGNSHRTQQERAPYHVPYCLTPQDHILYAMCRPERLLDLVRNATLFEAGQRKMARHHQYFAVEHTLQWLRQPLVDGRRPGGMIMHAEGSGKSLTMVFLARRLALAMDWPQPKIVVISPRPELGMQMDNSFTACRMHALRVHSGRQLLAEIARDKAQLIFTLPHALARASGIRKNRDESSDIFLLVEEDHQQPVGQYATLLRNMFPNACYIGFCGTPLDEHAMVWPLIDQYSAQEAEADQLLVPLIYENREQESFGDADWLVRQSEGWQPEVRDSLQRSAACGYRLAASERRAFEIALDISTHFRNCYQASGLKGQLVAPDHQSALRYKALLDHFGLLDSALLLSGSAIELDASLGPRTPAPKKRRGRPRTRALGSDAQNTFRTGAGGGHSTNGAGASHAASGFQASLFSDSPATPLELALCLDASHLLQTLWHETIAAYGTEDAYRHQIIQQFTSSSKPELFIVVDQLLDDFADSHLTVLYLARQLNGHTLLQALARVNRAIPDGAKPFGQIVDYVGNLDAQPALLADLPDDPMPMDLSQASVQAGIRRAEPMIVALPACHADCWALFKISRRHDVQDLLEHELGQPVLRSEFQIRLEHFAETLNLALGHARFMRECPPGVLQEYKQDALRFLQLKLALQLRYAEPVAISQAEAMLWRRLNPTRRALPVVNLLEPAQFQQTLSDFGFSSPHAQADAIAHHMLRHFARHQSDEPQQLKLQEQVQHVMRDFEVHRIDADTFLARIRQCYAQLLQPLGEPQAEEILQTDGLTLALYSLIMPLLQTRDDASDNAAQANVWALAAAQAFQAALQQPAQSAHLDDSDQIKQIGNQIDDYLCDVMEKQGQICLTSSEKDALITQILHLARQRGIP